MAERSIEEFLNSLRIRVDELEDRLDVELNELAEMMDNGDFSSARKKLRAMIHSLRMLEEESDAGSDSIRKDSETNSAS
jgi:hypothetical protein